MVRAGKEGTDTGRFQGRWQESETLPLCGPHFLCERKGRAICRKSSGEKIFPKVDNSFQYSSCSSERGDLTVETQNDLQADLTALLSLEIRNQRYLHANVSEER